MSQNNPQKAKFPGYPNNQPRGHTDFGQAGYSQQYAYPPTLQSVPQNAGHDMSKQVPAGQPGMYSNSGCMPSGPQHHHQGAMAVPAPSQQATMVQSGQQMGRQPMQISRFYAQNNVPRTVQSLGRNPMPSVVNQQQQQASSQFSHAMPMVPSHPMHTIGPLLVNPQLTQMYPPQRAFASQYSILGPANQPLYYPNFVGTQNNYAPPQNANGYYQPHQMQSYNTMPSQMPPMAPPAPAAPQTQKRRLQIIDPSTGKDIFEAETSPPKENEQDSNICIQFATQVAQAIANSDKGDPKSVSVEGPPITEQPVVICPDSVETQNLEILDNSSVEICEQFIDPNLGMPEAPEPLPCCNKEDLPSVNDIYDSKCLVEQLGSIPDVGVPDTKMLEVVLDEIPIVDSIENEPDILLPREEVIVQKPEVIYDVQEVVQIQPNSQLVTEISAIAAEPEVNTVVSQHSPVMDESDTVPLNVDIQESSTNLKAQEKQAHESKKNKAKKKKDLNKRGESKEGGDMDAFLDMAEEAPSKSSPSAPLSPVAEPVPVVTPVSPVVEQRPSTPPISTIVDTEILSTIPLPGETIEPLPNDVSPADNQLEEVNSVSPSAEMEEKENAEDEQGKMVLKYSYKEDQWSPLNPEGKKQYDRDFLLQLQSQPMSLCKPTNLPNLDVIKDKAHIQKLTEVNNRTAPLPVASIRAYDPFMPNFCARSGPPRLPHPPMGRRGQQGRSDKKPTKIINLPSSQNIKLHESENAWKPSIVKPRPGDNAETQELNKKVRGILNKLTPQKFETLVEQVKNLDINTEEKLTGVIDLVFEKAIDEPNFSVPYANMCKQLAMLRVPKTENPEEDVNFRKLLLTKCQREFEQDTRDELNREERLQAIEAAEDPVKKKELQFEFDQEAKKMRYRQLGNIRFIGELFKLGMLIEPIMHECIKKLLQQGDEESIECLCKLLKTIGKELEDKGDKNMQTITLMEQYFAQMQKIVNARLTSSRVRFMLQDVIDLRKGNWIPRRDENNPKTIDQIHKEAEKEAREQQQQVYQNMSYPKRMPDDRRKTPGRNMGVSEDGWTPSSKGTKGLYSVDPSKLKLTKPDEVESIRLGPCGRGISWSRGSSGGTKTPSEAENKTALANRFTALAEQSMTTPSYENRRGSQRSAASSRESSRGRNSQLSSAAVRKTPSNSRERENLIETVKELNRTVAAEAKTQEAKKHLDSQLNGKAVETTALALKGPDYSEEEVDKKTKPLIEEFLHNVDFEEAIKCVMELASPTTVHYFIYSAINQVLERSSQARNLLGQLLYSLVKKELITLDQFKKGLCGVLENMDDYALDIPLIWEYMGELLEPIIEDNKLPMSFLKEAFEPCIPSITAGKLVSAVLHCAAKKKGTIKLGELWRESGLQWTDFLDSSTDIKEFISSHNLDFTVSPVKKVVSNEDLSMDEIQTQLKNLLDSTNPDDNEKIFDWIDARVPQSAFTEPSFIRALATVVHQSAITGRDNKCDFNAEVLKKRIPLLTRYIDHNENLELQVLYAVQRLVNDLGQPKDILRQIFDILYDDDVIPEETLKQWEKSTDPNELEGKSFALSEVRGFFTWLRETEESGEDNDIVEE